MPEVEIGDVLVGKYRVERILGTGGMGFVVAATHLTLDERVALKFMRASALARDDGVERFLREARAAVKLKSEHVARVLDVGTLDSGSPYIVMEYLEGRDLSRELAERRTLTPAEIVDYLLQACDAVAEAHAIGIVHRDLKPANLFVTNGRDGAPLVKVLDFGISKTSALGDHPQSVTDSAVLLGSPVYMSPEQMKSSRDAGPASDVWSLGIILYEALAGRVPYMGETLGALMAKVLTDPPPLGALDHLPAELVGVVARCLEKDPSRRFASVIDFASALVPFGPRSSAERVSKIVSLRPTAHPSHDGVATLSPLAATQGAATLGVATTQAVTSQPTGGSVAPASRRAWLYVNLGVGVALVSAVAAIGLRARDGAPAATYGATPASSPSASPAPSTVPVPTTSESAVPVASRTTVPSSSTSSPPAAEAGAAPSHHPATPVQRERHSSAPAPSASTAKPGPSADPFGTSRE